MIFITGILIDPAIKTIMSKINIAKNESNLTITQTKSIWIDLQKSVKSICNTISSVIAHIAKTNILYKKCNNSLRLRLRSSTSKMKLQMPDRSSITITNLKNGLEIGSRDRWNIPSILEGLIGNIITIDIAKRCTIGNVIIPILPNLLITHVSAVEI